MKNSARVRVPATSANLGPGFDALGIALRISNTVTVRRDAGSVPDAMADEAADAFFSAAKRKAFPFAWSIRGAVPRSRGLGSSVTVRLGLLHGLNALSGSPLDNERLYHLCARLEGHPDNAAPAAFGGFTVARPDGSFQRFKVSPKLTFVLLIPDYEVRTADARKVLPAQLPYKDAVRSAANAAAIAAAFASANYEALRGSPRNPSSGSPRNPSAGCFEDFLHQPYRAPLVPGLDKVIAAGVKAGALGGWLSGSGSTIACLALGDPAKVARAMKKAFGAGRADVVTTVADNRGAAVLAG
jgi:homoserine kinase